MNFDNTPIKTNILSRDALDEILCNGKLEFLIAFNKNGEIERFVPESVSCDCDSVEFPILVEQIEDIQQLQITTFAVKPKIASSSNCIKYCCVNGRCVCCRYA